MKNLSLAINFVLLALIIALFFMYSSLKKSIGGGSESSSSSPATASSSTKAKGARIAYINADSINANYKMMKDFKAEFQDKQAALQNEYDVKGRKLQAEYAEYQQKAQSGNISQIDAQNAQKDMEQKKAELDNLQRKEEELTKEVQDKNLAINQKVQDYIVEYNKKAHYDYVLGYTNLGGTVLYANDSLDITRQIVSALNKMYDDSISKAQRPKH